MQGLTLFINSIFIFSVSIKKYSSLSALTSALFKEPKGPGGRPSYDFLMMFKILILQRYYNISDDQRKTIFDGPAKEKEISEDMRLDGLYTMYTTDDHGMHIVGKSKDQNGKEYYKVKNSWGETNDYKGYLYVTKTFVQCASNIYNQSCE